MNATSVELAFIIIFMIILVTSSGGGVNNKYKPSVSKLHVNGVVAPLISPKII